MGVKSSITVVHCHIVTESKARRKPQGWLLLTVVDSEQLPGTVNCQLLSTTVAGPVRSCTSSLKQNHEGYYKYDRKLLWFCGDAVLVLVFKTA